jgi:hypothetical protein
MRRMLIALVDEPVTDGRGGDMVGESAIEDNGLGLRPERKERPRDEIYTLGK